jgi:hypothetical protein
MVDNPNVIGVLSGSTYSSPNVLYGSSVDEALDDDDDDEEFRFRFCGRRLCVGRLRRKSMYSGS